MRKRSKRIVTKMNKDVFKIYIRKFIENGLWWHITKSEITNRDPGNLINLLIDSLADYAYESAHREIDFGEPIYMFKGPEGLTPYEFMDMLGSEYVTFVRFELENDFNNKNARITHLCILILFARFCYDKNKYFDLVLLKYLSKEETNYLLEVLGDEISIAG